MSYNPPGPSGGSMALTNYLFDRVRADVHFLHSQHLLDSEARDTILSRVDAAASRAASAPNGGTGPDMQVAALAHQFGGAVNVSNQPPPPAPPAVPVRTGYDANDNREKAKALWNYHGSQADDLSFTKGDIIVIVTRENEHWWRGSVQSDHSGRVGLFPSNHVEMLPPGSATSGGYPSAPAYSSPAPSNPSYYGSEHEKGQMQTYQQQPPPPQQTYYQSGPPPPPQPYYGTPQAPVPAPSPNTEAKKNKFKIGGNGLGNTLAHAGVGGLGFGAGSAVGSGIINSIF